MRIIGPPSANRDLVPLLLPQPLTNEFRHEVIPALWQWAGVYGIDPVGVIAQSYKETGGGRFNGAVGARWHNTCGLKIRYVGIVPGVTDGDAPLAHAMFPSWEVGALAHVQHLCAYTGLNPTVVEPGVPIVDPRFTYVRPPRAENWSELGGRWAPSPTYGAEIEAIMTSIRTAVTST